MSTVSIVTSAGKQHIRFINQWWDSVKTLERKPDEIVLVADSEDEANLLDSVPEWVDCKVVKIRQTCQTVHEYFTLGFNATTSDWIVIMCIDDQFLPAALNAVDETDADLIIDRILMNNGQEWPAVWNPENKHSRSSAPGGLAPFRRTLLPIWNEIPNDCVWDDTLFYLLLIKNNVSVYKTNNLRMMHDLGFDRQTISGVNRDPGKAAQADEQLNRYKMLLNCQ